MIQFKMKFDDRILKAIGDLPYQIQYKCIDPAARRMAQPIVRQAKLDPPSSRSLSGTQRWAQDKSVAPRDKWSKSARETYKKYDSGQHVVSKYRKYSRGGILYIGMQATKQGMGRKMHFRLPVEKKKRILFYWGKPGQIITQQAGRSKQTITYTRGQSKRQAKREKNSRYIQPGSTIKLERAHFLKRAYQKTFNQSLGIFQAEFYKQAGGLTLG